MMTFGSTSPTEFDAMDPVETMELAKRIAAQERQRIELYVTLAKFVAGARMGGGGRAEEIR